MNTNENPIASRKRTFLNRNLVAIVMVPTLIGIHFGWSMLQNNKALVREDERMELPILAASRLLWKKIRGESGTGNATAPSQK